MKHMNIKRIIKRCTEELNATIRIAKVTSVKEALITFLAKIDIQIMNRNGHKETLKIKEHLIKKHDIMIRYFEETLSEFIKNYKDKEIVNIKNKSVSDNIWICWWQGKENAPEIVKKCINSIEKNAGNHPVIILTEDNYKEYVNIPEWIQEKYKKGIISRTHYSDILRVELLSTHGGIWLDSTFFCVSQISEYFELPIWTIKRPDYNRDSVACGYFANYSLGCNLENRKIFKVIKEFLEEYWLKNDMIVDYLFLDYLIVLAQKYNKNVAECFKKIAPNNPNCDELGKVLNEEYDENKWKELKKDTKLFKLTWKQSFIKEKNGKKTFYGKLLEDEL